MATRAGPIETTEILRLEGVHLVASDRNDDVRGELCLRAGDVAMLQVGRTTQGALLSDACAGLATPVSGTVRFMQHDWHALDPERGNALRAIQGRVFYRGNWVNSLDVSENVLLPALHHGLRPRSQLLTEAVYLARQFGLPGLPAGSPADLDTDTAQRAACVRAFLGAPRLLVLEHPTAGVGPPLLAALVNAVRAACNRGAAALWLTPSQRVWLDRSVPVTQRLRLTRNVLVAAGGAA